MDYTSNNFECASRCKQKFQFDKTKEPGGRAAGTRRQRRYTAGKIRAALSLRSKHLKKDATQPSGLNHPHSQKSFSSLLFSALSPPEGVIMQCGFRQRFYVSILRSRQAAKAWDFGPHIRRFKSGLLSHQLQCWVTE